MPLMYSDIQVKEIRHFTQWNKIWTSQYQRHLIHWESDHRRWWNGITPLFFKLPVIESPTMKSSSFMKRLISINKSGKSM